MDKEIKLLNYQKNIFSELSGRMRFAGNMIVAIGLVRLLLGVRLLQSGEMDLNTMVVLLFAVGLIYIGFNLRGPADKMLNVANDSDNAVDTINKAFESLNASSTIFLVFVVVTVVFMVGSMF